MHFRYGPIEIKIRRGENGASFHIDYQISPIAASSREAKKAQLILGFAP
jgi:hypothetical protein